MAIIIYGATECALCGKVINEDDDVVATSHFIGDTANPLWKYSDVGMHRQCFRTWDKRHEFVRLFNETFADTTFRDGTYHRMLDDGTITSPRRGYSAL